MNKEDYTFDYLPNQNHLKLFQHKYMFRMNTDSCLLGNFLKLSSNSRVLDIGTNNGVLLLYASVYNCKELVGIDINDEAIKLANYNLTYNHVQNFHLYSLSVQEFKDINLFDVIICNPPYFQNSLKNSNPYLSLARHEDNLPLPILFKKVDELLKKDGSFYLVHRYQRYMDILKELSLYSLKIVDSQFIENKKTQNPETILLKIQRNKSE